MRGSAVERRTYRDAYRVQLHQADTWPDYRGPVTDNHELEIFEHWLEPAKEA